MSGLKIIKKGIPHYRVAVVGAGYSGVWFLKKLKSLHSVSSEIIRDESFLNQIIWPQNCVSHEAIRIHTRQIILNWLPLEYNVIYSQCDSWKK